MKILCAGPTSIDEKVLSKMSLSKTNPDLDPEYEAYHRGVEKKLSKLLHTDALTIFMLGEAIMTLEASIISLMEKGERVLVLYNGFFGEGFKEYVKNFGGEAVLFKGDFRHGLDVDEIRDFLEKDHDFALATMVHCETPSGITNDVKAICSLLKEYDILSIVDGVSTVGGEDIHFDEFNIDVLLGGSQKCLSAPAGIGMVTLSQRALDKIENRKTEIPSYYLNYKNHYAFEGNPFPYTMNENLIYAMDEAIDQAMEKELVKKHQVYGENTRKILQECGFELYPKDSFSNTVTTVVTPKGIESEDLLTEMRKRDIAISKGVGSITETTFRIGHMGHNMSVENFEAMYKAMDESFNALNIETKGSLYKSFLKYKDELEQFE